MNSDYAVFNPQNKTVEELPVIYGFNNGGALGWYQAVAIAEDGVCLGGHICSADYFIPYDLGILDGSREDRHENDYRKHYPDGYRMEFVPKEEVREHVELNRAVKLNKMQQAENVSN